MGRDSWKEESPAVGVWDSENNRLCCPECGYDLLRMDEADVTQEELVRGYDKEGPWLSSVCVFVFDLWERGE